MTKRTGRPPGAPAHKPTDDQRKIVEVAAIVGTPHHDIGPLIGVSIKTLLKHYANELRLGKTRANVKVGGALYRSALGGNIAAQIFWMKAQAGWREVQRLEHANADGKPLTHAVVAASVTDEDAMKEYLALISGKV
jgi:hypothetical protein